MSIKTTYTCDKCKKTQDTAEQFWSVGVVATTINNRLTNSFVTGKSMQVCRLCLESFGLYVQKKPDIEEQPIQPTIEDLIADLVHNAMDDI